MLETYGLTEAQRYQAMDYARFSPRHGERRQHLEWEELTDEQRKTAAVEWLKVHRPEDAPGKLSGVSQRQIDYIAAAVESAIVDQINPQLEPIVRGLLNKVFDEGVDLDQAAIHQLAARVADHVPAVRDFNKLQREVAALAQEVKTLNDSMLKFATAKATDDESSTTPSATSSQRQLSRHAEHLANLESRLKTLERNK
jgi:hypothetical protein